MTKRSRLAAAALGCSLTLAACGGGESDGADAAEDAPKLTGTIQIDGSSTVAPLTSAAAELFEEENPGVKVVVGTSGTGGGFEKFCGGETDISNASRAIKDEEAATCKTAGIAFEEVTVANDALSVVVNPENDWAKCLTVEQLKKIWEPNSKVKNWKEVDPSFPSEALTLYGPGTDSGTFDYFTDEINGEEGASRTDYQPSEDDNQIVTGIQGSKGALGYFGLSYVEENAGSVKAIEVDGGDGCVAPSAETVLDASYKPLSRPLFIYPSDKALARPEVKAFLEFFVENESKIAEEALFVELSDEQAEQAKAKIDSLSGA
jgi:phosphate transport system substrate-binding protein